MNDRANVYRRQYGYPHDWGTAANICSMVFGNMGEDCCTGVAFTRDPATGEKVFYGEYLINAQGEDVVAGIRTPKKIAELQKEMPAVYKQLDEIRALKSTIATCKISSSPSRRASSGCCKLATANAPGSPPSVSRWIWCTKG